MMTRVLPEPAPARTSSGPSVVVTASRCGPLSPERSMRPHRSEWSRTQGVAKDKKAPLDPSAAREMVLKLDRRLFLEELNRLTQGFTADPGNPGSYNCTECARCANCMFCKTCEACYQCNYC